MLQNCSQMNATVHHQWKVNTVSVNGWGFQVKAITLANAMMTSSNGNIFRVTGHLCGEFPVTGEVPAQRPVTRSCGVFLLFAPE